MPLDRSRSVGKPGKSFQEWLTLSKRESGCWRWQGSLNKHGYGHSHMRFGGKVEVWAHRISWIVANGPIPKDKEIDHAVCENRDCVNPAHMELVTRQVNLERRRTYGVRIQRDGRPQCGHPREFSEDGRLKPCKACRDKSVQRWRDNNPDWRTRHRLAQAKYANRKGTEGA